MRVLVGAAHECCEATMTLQAEGSEITEPGLLHTARHVCLGCGLTLELSALVPHERVDELRGKRAPGGRATATPPDLASVGPTP